MPTPSLAHLSDTALLRDLHDLVARERATTAALLAHIAEVDARRLYAPAGYSSMHAYCVHALRLSEDAAFKRILAARTARRFPELFDLVAEGRLHLTAVRLLAPHLTPGSADELLQAAVGLSRSALELLLARRFPSGADFATLRPQLADPASPRGHAAPARPAAAGLFQSPAPEGAAETPAPGPRVPGPVEASPAPEAPRARFLLQVTIGEATRDKLHHAQALLAHSVAPGDVAQVLDRALDALITNLERRKFARVVRPRPRRRVELATSIRSRFVPAAIRRAVWERDGGRCTFIGSGGHRCQARRFLEFDHVDPVARGGRPSMAGMRLRCRTHNRLEAERAFGAAHVARRVEEARATRKPTRGGAPSSVVQSEDGANGSRDPLAAPAPPEVSTPQDGRAPESDPASPGLPLEAQLRSALDTLRPRGAGPGPRSNPGPAIGSDDASRGRAP